MIFRGAARDAISGHGIPVCCQIACLSVPSTRTSSSSSPKSAYTSERVNTRLVVMLTCSLGGGDEAGVLSSTEDMANDGDGLQDMVIEK